MIPKLTFSILGHTVAEVGSIIKDKFDWFSGSADGLIMNKNDAPGVYGLLEIKSIYSCRNGGEIHGCKFLDKTGNFLLKGPYYTQVQLCCWATGASYINLFLYTPHHNKIIHVPLDPQYV